MEITAGGLFDGIGGFPLGLEQAGIKSLWSVEIDDWCQGKIKKQFPDMEIFGDIREVGKHNLAAVDIITGGFPCQPFSGAGERRGAEDDRYLWPEMLRVINEIRPTWVIGENVAGLESMGLPIGDVQVASRYITNYADQDHYKGIYTLQERMFVNYICEQFEGIGYDVQPFNIPAIALGAFHVRRRIWFVAHRKGSDDGQRNSGETKRQESQPGEGGCAEPLPNSRREHGTGEKKSGEFAEPDRQRDAAEPERPIKRDGSGADPAPIPDGESNAERGLSLREEKALARLREYGENISFSKGAGLEGRGDGGDARQNLSGFGESSGAKQIKWSLEPDLGQLVNGLPAGLVARLGGGDIPRNAPIPRVATGIPGRKHKLKALGNAIYPPHAKMFGEMIKQIMENN